MTCRVMNKSLNKLIANKIVYNNLSLNKNMNNTSISDMNALMRDLSIDINDLYIIHVTGTKGKGLRKPHSSREKTN